MKTLALLLALLVGCVTEDDDRVPKETPTCESLGCENSFCTADGVCACEGVTCVLCARTDAGMCTDPAQD